MAYRLSLHSYKSFQDLNRKAKVHTAKLHLEAWANYTLTALEACRGRPSIIFPTTLVASRATVEIAASILYESLAEIGQSSRLWNMPR